MDDIRHNLATIQTRISSAAARVSRDPKTVTLVAISKLKSVADIRSAREAGQEDFGENYVQELLRKQTEFHPEKIRWHFVGHLQTRKVRDVMGAVSLLHSLDSLKLALEIEKQAQAKEVVQAALIQVNLSGELTKSGMKPEEAPLFLETVASFKHLDVTGLMILPPPSEDPEESRPFFKKLFEWRERVNAQAVYRHPLTELSMGMSHDFEVAIEEGATIVRIGTALFGERQVPFDNPSASSGRRLGTTSKK